MYMDTRANLDYWSTDNCCVRWSLKTGACTIGTVSLIWQALMVAAGVMMLVECPVTTNLYQSNDTLALEAGSVVENASVLVDSVSNVSVPEYSASNVSVPEYSVSNVSVPEYSASNVSVPEYSASNVSVPEYSASNVSVPEYSASNVSVPEYSASNVSVPEYSASNVNVPEYSVSIVSVSEHSASNVSVPEYSASNVSVPEYSASKVNVPEYSASKVNVPEYSASKVSVPEYNVSNVSVPEYSVSYVSVPEYSASNVNVPEDSASIMPVTEDIGNNSSNSGTDVNFSCPWLPGPETEVLGINDKEKLLMVAGVFISYCSVYCILSLCVVLGAIKDSVPLLKGWVAFTGVHNIVILAFLLVPLPFTTLPHLLFSITHFIISLYTWAVVKSFMHTLKVEANKPLLAEGAITDYTVDGVDVTEIPVEV